MDWQDIGKSLISQGVPLIGGLLAGPAGASVGKIVAGLFDANPDKPETVMNAIQSNPDAVLKLREYENSHIQKLQELQLEETKAFLSDIDSARKREMAGVAATGKRDWFMYGLALLIIIPFFALMVYLLWGVMQPQAKDAENTLKDNPLVMLIVGALISGFTQVLSYFFGSSQGSSDKSRTMAVSPSAKG
jgi:hypothetical protein